MSTHSSDGLSIRSYLGVILRWKWVVLAVTVLVTLAGAAYTWTRTPLYAATTDLLYVNQIDIANPLAQTYVDASAQQAEIESAPTVVGSSSVQSGARGLMKPSTVDAGYWVTTTLTPGLNNLYSNVISIQASSPDPAAAADAANATAQAFIAWGRDSARAQVDDAIAVVKSQLSALANEGARGSSEYRSLQNTLQQLELLQASASGNFKVITAASEPGVPYSPRKTRGVILAFAGGLVLGIALAFLLEQFDTRVRSDHEITELLDLPVIGHVPPYGRKHRDRGALLTLSEPSGAAAEAFRVLRSNLDFVSLDHEVRTLLVASSVQGEGKSLTACNLAVSMALAGKRVVLVDGDLRAPRVHVYMGIPNAVGVTSVMARRADISRALVPVVLSAAPDSSGELVMTTNWGPPAARRGPEFVWAEGKHIAMPFAARRGPEAPVTGPAGAGGVADAARNAAVQTETAPAADATPPPDGAGDTRVLRVLPSGPLPPNPGEMITSRRFGEMLAGLSASADLVLVDAPAMLPVGDVAALAPWVDALVFVVNADKVRRPALRQAKAQLDRLPCRKLGLIEVAEKKGHGRYYGGYYSRTGGASGDGGRSLETG